MSGLREVVKHFLDQREEYVRVLRQCVDADADYHRWQGHAEARRQLGRSLEDAGVDLIAEPGPVAVSERVAQVLDMHYYDASWSREHQGFRCVCSWLGDSHVQHVTDVLAAAVFRAEATVKAEALREAAQAQRQLAPARTNNGQAEHTDIADWLDDRAFAIDPAVVEGAHQ